MPGEIIIIFLTIDNQTLYQHAGYGNRLGWPAHCATAGSGSRLGWPAHCATAGSGLAGCLQTHKTLSWQCVSLFFLSLPLLEVGLGVLSVLCMCHIVGLSKL